MHRADSEVVCVGFRDEKIGETRRFGYSNLTMSVRSENRTNVIHSSQAIADNRTKAGQNKCFILIAAFTFIQSRSKVDETLSEVNHPKA